MINMVKAIMSRGDVMAWLNVQADEFALVMDGGGIAPNGSHVNVIPMDQNMVKVTLTGYARIPFRQDMLGMLRAKFAHV